MFDRHRALEDGHWGDWGYGFCWAHVPSSAARLTVTSSWPGQGPARSVSGPNSPQPVAGCSNVPRPGEPPDPNSGLNCGLMVVERVIRFADGVRGLLGALIIGGIGVAAARSGGTAGWVVGGVLLTVSAVFVGLAVRSAAASLAFRRRA